MGSLQIRSSKYSNKIIGETKLILVAYIEVLRPAILINLHLVKLSFLLCIPGVLLLGFFFLLKEFDLLLFLLLLFRLDLFHCFIQISGCQSFHRPENASLLGNIDVTRFCHVNIF